MSNLYITYRIHTMNIVKDQLHFTSNFIADSMNNSRGKAVVKQS